MRRFLGRFHLTATRRVSAPVVVVLLVALAARPAAGLAAQNPGSAAGAPDPFQGASELDRAALQAAVLERNQRLAATRAALLAAEARVDGAAGLENLSLRSGLAPLSIGSSTVDLGFEVEAMQMLPSGGRRPLRRAVAAAEAEQADAELAVLRLELAEQASNLYDDLYLARRALATTAEHARLLEDLSRVAAARYAAGLASQQDLLQAEVELAHLQHDVVLLQSAEESTRAMVNALLHRDSGAALPPLPEALPALPAKQLDDALLHEQALAARPELRANAAGIRAREGALALARLGGRPDFGVGAAYSSMWSDDEHRFTIGGTLSWPVWRKRVRAAAAEAEAQLLEAESSRQALLDEVQRDVAVALAGLRAAHHLVDVLESRLLPASRDRLRAARAAFEAGRDDFTALVGAARDLRSFELRYHEALVGLYRSHAALERAAGGGEAIDRTEAAGSRQAAVSDQTSDRVGEREPGGPAIPNAGVEP
jgi:outer membrane protein TolC